MKQVKKQILRADCLIAASQHQSTTVAAQVSTCVSWPKLWDMALDHGERGTAALQALFRTLTRPTIGQNTCPVCKTQQAEISHFEQFVTCHTPIASSEFVIYLLPRAKMCSYMRSIFYILHSFSIHCIFSIIYCIYTITCAMPPSGFMCINFDFDSHSCLYMRAIYIDMRCRYVGTQYMCVSVRTFRILLPGPFLTKFRNCLFAPPLANGPANGPPRSQYAYI